MIKSTLSRFKQRPLNEQRLIITLGACSLIILFWFGLYQPLGKAIDAQQSKYDRSRNDLKWFGKQVAAAGLLPEKKLTRKSDALLRDSLKKAKLVATVQQGSTGEFSVFATNIKMDSFVSWLEEIQVTYGLRVVELEFHASPQAADSINLTRLTIGVKHNG